MCNDKMTPEQLELLANVIDAQLNWFNTFGYAKEIGLYYKDYLFDEMMAFETVVLINDNFYTMTTRFEKKFSQTFNFFTDNMDDVISLDVY